MNRKGKRIFLLGIAVLFLAAGCGKKQQTKTELALVTDGQSTSSAVFESLQSGMEKYSQKEGKKSAVYIPEARSEEGYEKAIEQAVEKGAEVVVCAGDSMSRAVYEAQRENRNVRFLFLDGVPENEKGEQYIRGNTECIRIATAEAGYLAGYAAVASGYQKLGFLGGSSTVTREYGTGFALGADQAAADLELEKDSITLEYCFRKKNDASPEFLDQLISWYQEGGQILFTDGNAFQNVVAAAAEQTGGAVLWNGGSPDSSSALLQVRLEYGNVVNDALSDMEKDQFEGGKIVYTGVKEKNITLDWNRDKLPAFTEAQYQKACGKLTGEDFEMPDNDALQQPEECGIARIRISSLELRRTSAQETPAK